MKKIYKTPIVDIRKFRYENVVTSSAPGGKTARDLAVEELNEQGVSDTFELTL